MIRVILVLLWATLAAGVAFPAAAREAAISAPLIAGSLQPASEAAIPLVLLTGNFAWTDIPDWLRAAVLGFDIGPARVSLVRILLAAVLFLAFLFGTRLFQRWLLAKPLAPPRVEAGIAHSISTVAGYAGIALGLFIAASVAGLDLSSLAIVAGALSVGIGFGLQSIVNNFVSGLILLIERPVKVGDWIVVKETAGHVRRIAVRATEIETLDRASVIIPNSELITGAVTNWTHRNALGRLAIRVPVHYRSDPGEVHAILERVARESRSILEHPPAAVTLDALGAAALEYSLRVYVADVNRAPEIESELRTAILEALREANVQVPYPPHDGDLGGASSPRTAAVKIDVAKESDPDHVQAVLAGAAKSVAGKGSRPPAVYLEAIGPSGIAYSVEAAIDGDQDVREVESALRTAVLKALRAAEIELSHPRSDVRLRDLDPVRALLTRMAEERAASEAEGVVPDATLPRGGR